MWSTFARRKERLVVGVFASKVCTANGVLHLSVRLCSARLSAIVHSSSLDRRVSASASAPPKLCLRVRTTLVPPAVPAACGCVPRGQIDRSSCLVEPVVVGRAILLSTVLAQTCT